MRHWFRFVLVAAAVMFTFCRAQKEVGVPKDVQDDEIAVQSAESPFEASLFLQVYHQIIEVSCMLGGCHDGSFEPNYLSPQDFYFTTVYHPVIKNSEDGRFMYRVVPYDTANSVLYERITNCCFIDQNDLMPILMEPLTPEEINLISRWIMEGAPNWNGEFPWKQIISEN